MAEGQGSRIHAAAAWRQIKNYADFPAGISGYIEDMDSFLDNKVIADLKLHDNQMHYAVVVGYSIIAQFAWAGDAEEFASRAPYQDRGVRVIDLDTGEIQWSNPQISGC